MEHSPLIRRTVLDRDGSVESYPKEQIVNMQKCMAGMRSFLLLVAITYGYVDAAEREGNTMWKATLLACFAIAAFGAFGAILSSDPIGAIICGFVAGKAISSLIFG